MPTTNTLTKEEWRVLRAITADRRDAQSIAQTTKLAAPKVRRMLARLAKLRVVERTELGQEHRWRLTKRGAGMVRMAG